MVSISSYSISLNFASTRNRIPTQKIISSVESSIVTLLKIELDQVCFETNRIHRKAKSHSSSNEKMAVQNIIYADKSDATVVLNTSKVNELLQDGSWYIGKTDCFI